MILDAAIPLFVEQGFKGVTTRLLAQKAGVSEALLYQHFPSKEALYSEVQEVLCASSPHLSSHLSSLPPSAETLVWVLYVAARFMIDPPKNIDTSPLFPRLMLQSLMEDGEFARLHTELRLGDITQVVRRSMEAARADGAMVEGGPEGIPDHLLFWFGHHVMAMVHLMQLPDKPILDYPEDRTQLINFVMCYVLRGMGMTDRALKKYYCPTELYQRFADTFGLDLR
jgi:TetR/AcrR family transcriptional regulator, transcriptional repressor of aconitase